MRAQGQVTLCLCLCHLCWAEVTLCLCLCHPCWAEVTWGTRSHRHVTASATSPELLWLQDLLLRGTQEGSLARHEVAWQRHPLSTPLPGEEAHSLLHLPSTPRAHSAELALDRGEHLPRAALNLTCGRAFLHSQLPGKEAGLVFGIFLGRSSST